MNPVLRLQKILKDPKSLTLQEFNVAVENARKEIYPTARERAISAFLTHVVYKRSAWDKVKHQFWIFKFRTLCNSLSFSAFKYKVWINWDFHPGPNITQYPRLRLEIQSHSSNPNQIHKKFEWPNGIAFSVKKLKTPPKQLCIYNTIKRN